MADGYTYIDLIQDRIDEGHVHPATAQVLRYFAYDHLPEHLQEISKPFGDLAIDLAVRLDGPEVTVGLRKILEAKDCMVRAALPDTGYPLVDRSGAQRGPEEFRPGTD